MLKANVGREVMTIFVDRIHNLSKLHECKFILSK